MNSILAVPPENEIGPTVDDINQSFELARQEQQEREALVCTLAATALYGQLSPETEQGNLDN